MTLGSAKRLKNTNAIPPLPLLPPRVIDAQEELKQ
jgi:hypothetical protein